MTIIGDMNLNRRLAKQKLERFLCSRNAFISTNFLSYSPILFPNTQSSQQRKHLFTYTQHTLCSTHWFPGHAFVRVTVMLFIIALCPKLDWKIAHKRIYMLKERAFGWRDSYSQRWRIALPRIIKLGCV